MNLIKRTTDVSIELLPLGADFLRIDFSIQGDNYSFFPNSVVCRQFGAFLHELFLIYHEKGYWHRNDYKCRPKRTLDRSNGCFVFETFFVWDSENHIDCFRLKRIDVLPESGHPDPVEFTINEKTYCVEGRDLCYAVAKACTDALKLCGIYGYYFSTGGDCDGVGDEINIGELLFIKAYALNALEARKLKLIREDDENCDHVLTSSFEKEIEVLLFDM